MTKSKKGMVTMGITYLATDTLPVVVESAYPLPTLCLDVVVKYLSYHYL